MKAPRKVMQSRFLARLIGAAAWLALATSASAAVLVSDGVPVSGTGAYNADATLQNQNPTHTSIIGEINAWLSTSAFVQVSGLGLEYPSSYQLSAIGGSLVATSATTSATIGRYTRRALLSPLGGKSFYFSVLMSYSDLSSLITGYAVSLGMTQIQPSSTAFPKDALMFGFRRSASGVEAVVMATNTITVIQSNVLPGTHFVVGKFVYNGAGADTIYASLDPGAAEPSSWAANVTVDLLSSGASFGYINVGGCIGLNSKSVYFDQWRVGDTYSDVVGVSSQPSPEGTMILLR